MQKPIQKFRQTFIVFKKPSILYGKLKTLTSFNYCRVAKILHTFPVYQSLQKGLRDSFYFV